jgi:hypothetical protein
VQVQVRRSDLPSGLALRQQPKDLLRRRNDLLYQPFDHEAVGRIEQPDRNRGRRVEQAAPTSVSAALLSIIIRNEQITNMFLINLEIGHAKQVLSGLAVLGVPDSGEAFPNGTGDDPGLMVRSHHGVRFSRARLSVR